MSDESFINQIRKRQSSEPVEPGKEKQAKPVNGVYKCCDCRHWLSRCGLGYRTKWDSKPCWQASYKPKEERRQH